MGCERCRAASSSPFRGPAGDLPRAERESGSENAEMICRCSITQFFNVIG